MRGKRALKRPGSLKTRNIPAYAGKTQRRLLGQRMPPEHPRIRGENRVPASEPVMPAGTSPRMRGKQANLADVATFYRNIPAYAGKTVWGWGRLMRCWEHPRVCGENRYLSNQATTLAGTSPRMRGKRTTSDAVAATRRNIPAYAGKTKTCPDLVFYAQEHPRVRGENTQHGYTSEDHAGTSSRMRGK